MAARTVRCTEGAISKVIGAMASSPYILKHLLAYTNNKRRNI